MFGKLFGLGNQDSRKAKHKRYMQHWRDRVQEEALKLSGQPFSVQQIKELSDESKTQDFHLSPRAMLAVIRTAGFRTEYETLKEYGDINPNAECIFCGKTGGVRVKVTTITEQHRVNSVAGRAVGLGMNSQKEGIQRHCDNCGGTWTQ